MHMTEKYRRQSYLPLSWHPKQQRHPLEFFHHADWSMIATAVLKKLLAVICGKRKYTFVPAIRPLQIVHQPSDLAVDPSDACVIQLDNRLFVAIQGRWR